MTYNVATTTYSPFSDHSLNLCFMQDVDIITGALLKLWWRDIDWPFSNSALRLSHTCFQYLYLGCRAHMDGGTGPEVGRQRLHASSTVFRWKESGSSSLAVKELRQRNTLGFVHMFSVGFIRLDEVQRKSTVSLLVNLLSACKQSRHSGYCSPTHMFAEL